MKKILLLVVFLSLPAAGDGVKFDSHGRFPKGKISVFKLTKYQQNLIEYYYRCRSDNAQSPFVFKLSGEQATKLGSEAGISPELLVISSSYNGDIGVEITINNINRFSKQEFEVPHDLLVNDVVARDYELNIIGWQPSPFVGLGVEQLTGPCIGSPNKQV